MKLIIMVKKLKEELGLIDSNIIKYNIFYYSLY